MLTEGGREGSPMPAGEQQMPAERPDQGQSAVPPKEASAPPERAENVGFFARGMRGLVNILKDIGSGRAQRLNPHAPPPLETSPQQSDSSQVREPSNS